MTAMRKQCPQNERDVGMKLQSENKSHLNQCSWRDCLGHPSIAKDSEKFLIMRVTASINPKAIKTLVMAEMVGVTASDIRAKRRIPRD